ncbi:magnesium transporter CorA family protein [Rhizobium sp. P38BS-XIX]|uniref:magnesium transporter CorA family protein n=1 Tax=Rhizobium sp. P38BS-XIX TaxID=2726740 RepID=UPI00145651A8|nr:magnesium transporter CorA family protein [Rhizobium sp. P38BS-XIX]NLS01323.1 magnesium transporter CorA family protein [Rhizobium sp. P38BS-XIX]
MLNTFPAQGSHQADKADKSIKDALWIDLLDPSDEEIANVEKLFGITLPSLGALSEIEASSRLKAVDDVLYMSTPSAAKRPEGAEATPPVGFVLSADRLVTVRFMSLPTFDAVAAKFDGTKDAPKSSLEVFVLLCEEIVSHVADILEHLAAELNRLSKDAFRAEDPRGRHPARANRILRGQLRQLGRLGDRLSEIRDGLLGLARVLAYSEQNACDWHGGALKPRVGSLRQDLHSLSEYDEQLANKVQFVLDALVGLIGIAQNDVFKVLTIVSIVGIPPTLMAGVYGMNFKNMPEYDWVWGYPYGWAVIIISALIPLVWFKVKGWF